MESQPKISIVIPTFKRLNFLKRAVDSVKAQSFSDWELVVSDDENPSGKTWDYLQRLATTDSRIKAIRNLGPHGQVGNMNNALKVARGTWIKPLYDDDALRTDCLGLLYKAVEEQDSVVMIRCLANQYYDNSLLKRVIRGKRAILELIPQKFVHLAMYLHDVDIGIPTQVMVNNASIKKGAIFENIPGLTTLVDVWWYCRILQHGDLLLLNKGLVDQHQGSHETTTNIVKESILEQQFVCLRELIFDRIDPSLNPPPIDVVKKMVWLIRAINRLINGKIFDALLLAVPSLNYKAIYLTARWVLTKSFQGHFRMVPRSVIEK